MPVSVEEILGGIVTAIIIGGLVYLVVKARRWSRADQAARATPLGEVVQVTTGQGCSLCGADLGGGYRGGGTAHRVAQLDLCDKCYAADFGDRLDDHGLRIQDVKILGYPREGSSGGTNRDIQGAVPYDLGITATFARRGDPASLDKRSSDEVLAEVPEFDQAVVVSTVTPETVSEALQDRGLREAIAASVNYAGFGFSLQQSAVKFGAYSASVEERAQLRCCAVVLLAHLERLAKARGLPLRPDYARYPDLSAFHIAGDSRIRRLFITHSLLDDLADVAAVYAAQATSSKPLAGLWLEQVHLRSGSLEPLRDLERFTFLKLDRVAAIRDFGPLAGLTQLEELIVNRCPFRDAEPLRELTQLRELSLAFTPLSDVTALGGLTALTQLDLRRTEVSDLAPLASLTQLEVLRVAGSPVTEASAQALRQALPRLQYDPY